MVDYLIVGSGLAGISFAETAISHNKSILVFDNYSQQSSKVAAGLYNPIVLKRFTNVWNAKEQLVFMNEFYSHLEMKLDIKIKFEKPILRKFSSIEEQNNWFIASDKIHLAPYLSQNLVSQNFSGIDSPFGYGEVLCTGYVDTALLLQEYRNYLLMNKQLIEEAFDYNAIEFHERGILYKGLEAKNIIFAEGYGLHLNPFFNYLPLDGVKGELLIIKAMGLELDAIVNSSIFILPLGNHLFKVGATYNWEDKSDVPTEEGKLELLSKIKENLTCNFEVVAHSAGIRPTVKDRKPLVGSHPNYPSMHVLNGLGTRGVMLGPTMAKALFDKIENNIPLDPLINCYRIKWVN